MPPETFITFTPDPGDPSWSREWVPVNHHSEPTAFEDLPQSAFIWNNFKVKVILKVGGVDFSQSMTNASVSILDFALMVQAARAIMRRGSTAEIGLSDRGDQWWFSRHGELVRLRTRGRSNQGWINGSCPAEVFEQLVDQSLTDALRLMFWEQPALRRNTYLQTLVSQAASTDARWRPDPR